MAITMEELKRKARAYDEALERAKKNYDVAQDLCSGSQIGVECFKNTLTNIFPELKESEDERIMKALVRFHKSTIDVDGIKGEDIIAWLEKQGEQKFADKVDPKFHEGDWIISNNNKYIYQVVDVKRGIYVIRDNADNQEYHIGIESAERDGRLWNISDAKDGDVLVDMHGNIGIFQECEDVFWHSYIYLGCDGTLRGFSIGGSHEQTDTHPATKEQSDNIMKAMADAGYEWDAEKKELKKVEPKFKIKLAGREYNVLEIKESAGVTFYGIEDEPNHIDYVLSDDCEIISGYGVNEKGNSYPTKSATFSEQTSAWTEEDECYMSECIGAIATKDGWSFEEKRKTKKWLQSFKQRIGG